MRMLMCCMTEYPLPFVAASPSRRRLTVFYVFVDKMPARRLTSEHRTAERRTGAFGNVRGEELQLHLVQNYGLSFIFLLNIRHIKLQISVI